MITYFYVLNATEKDEAVLKLPIDILWNIVHKNFIHESKIWAVQCILCHNCSRTKGIILFEHVRINSCENFKLIVLSIYYSFKLTIWKVLDICDRCIVRKSANTLLKYHKCNKYHTVKMLWKSRVYLSGTRGSKLDKKNVTYNSRNERPETK